MAVTLVLALLTFLMVTIACFKIVCDAWLGATPDVGRSLRFGLRRAWPAFLLTMVWTVCVFGARAADHSRDLAVRRWSLVDAGAAVRARRPDPGAPALVRAGQGPMVGDVPDRAGGLVLVRPVRHGRVAGPAAFAEIFAPENALANGIASVIGTTIAGVILYPYYSALLTIMYFDQRVRKEGFDLQLLAEGVGVEHDPDAPLPAPYVGGPSHAGSAPPRRTGRRRRLRRVAAARAEPWSSPGGWSAPAPAEDALRRAPTEDEGVSLKKKGNRADWLPPEAPRGPGGL